MFSFIYEKKVTLTYNVMGRFAVYMILFYFLFCFNPHKQDFLKTVTKLTNVSEP